MPCCGNKRAALAANSAYARAQKSLYAPAQSIPKIRPLLETGSIKLKYLGEKSLSLRGPASGQVYTFSKAGQVGVVSINDCSALINTGLFAREGG